jgi:hypothetical protein
MRCHSRAAPFVPRRGRNPHPPKALVSMDLAQRGQAMLIEETRMRHDFGCTPLPDIDAPAMLCLECRSVTDGDNCGARQPLT